MTSANAQGINTPIRILILIVINGKISREKKFLVIHKPKVNITLPLFSPNNTIIISIICKNSDTVTNIIKYL